MPDLTLRPRLPLSCAAAALLAATPLFAQPAVAPLPGIGTAGSRTSGNPLNTDAMRDAIQKRIADAKARPTPHRPDGKPDLDGIYTAGGPGMTGVKDGKTVALLFPDYGQGGKRAVVNGPKYKPELQKKVEYNDVHSSFVDKTFLCGMQGVPRIGPPQQIVQTDKGVVLLYVDLAGEVFRDVPTDGRGFREEIDASYNGDSVGHWDGDTLVIDSKNFSDETWFGGRGYFHSDKMTVQEKLKRGGATLTWTLTVMDPEVLAEPWTTSRTLVMTDTRLEEPPPCQDIVRDHLVNTDNHS